MTEQFPSQSASAELKNDSRFKFFRRLISAPYLLALVVLFLPLMNVSCAEKVIAEPSFYELATGIDLRETLKEPAKGYLLKMESDNERGSGPVRDCRRTCACGRVRVVHAPRFSHAGHSRDDIALGVPFQDGGTVPQFRDAGAIAGTELRHLCSVGADSDRDGDEHCGDCPPDYR